MHLSDLSRKGKNASETFVFADLPKNLEQLKALPEAALNTPFQTAALAIAVLGCFEQDPETAFEMLDYLKGPAPASPFEKQFIRERLKGKAYKIFSFFWESSPENGYSPMVPYTITVSSNPYSFDNENWATLYVKSSGADSPRGIKLRKKPSTGQWFLNELQCLSDIRVPAEQDPWA